MNPTLTVNRTELQNALTSIARFIPDTGKAQAVFTYENRQLVIRMPGMEIKVPAEGSWPGQARLRMPVMAGLGRIELPGDPTLTITVTADRLRIGALSVPALWETGAAPAISLPFDPPLITVLRVSRRYNADAIERAGLAKVVAEAQEKKDDMLAEAIRNLAPLGIRPDVVERLVEESLSRDDAPLTLLEAEQRL